MTKEQLNLSIKLNGMIDNTRAARNEIDMWIKSKKGYGMLRISDYADDSVFKVVLHPNIDNAEILIAIREKLSQQLEKYEADFAAL